MYAENALFFPHAAIPALRHLRGPGWQALVERVLPLPETHVETLALMLVMMRINGCVGCETDSYRAMRGCTACAVQTLRRYKGSDSELLALFDQALIEVRRFAAARPHPLIIEDARSADSADRQDNDAVAVIIADRRAVEAADGDPLIRPA